MPETTQWQYPLEQLATDFRAHADLDERRFSEVREAIQELSRQIAKVVAMAGVGVAVAVPLLTEAVRYLLGPHAAP